MAGHRLAHHPLQIRDESRLVLVNCATGRIQISHLFLPLSVVDGMLFHAIITPTMPKV